MDGQRKERLVLNALITFADACTLPSLTPSCPFYELENDLPSCQEQCRQLASEMGSEDRPVVQQRIGGLVMKGRQIPKFVVGGMNDFDAGREFMAQRHLDPDSQSVTSLLIGLESHFIRAVLGSQTSINLTM